MKISTNPADAPRVAKLGALCNNFVPVDSLFPKAKERTSLDQRAKGCFLRQKGTTLDPPGK
jgi:hypothetical protein